jgi:serine/threonine protein kinase
MESNPEQKLWPQSSTGKILDLHYLKTITKNFSEDRIIGNGGFAIVYKGVKENGEVVAVKRLNMSKTGMDDKEFMDEVQHVMDRCHPNIVTLKGYCHETVKELASYNGRPVLAEKVDRLLCFEYLPNGSLEKHLRGMMILSSQIIVLLTRIWLSLLFFSDKSSELDWHTRYIIILGICDGLKCLHEGRDGVPILHLDLKPSNILLDKNMTPKISDFGLSRLFDEGKSHISTRNLKGTR